MTIQFILTLDTDADSDTASQDGPNDISFTKGGMLVIIDRYGEWWRASRVDE